MSTFTEKMSERVRLSPKMGERIREIRKALKLTQEEFGKELGGLSKSAVSKYESGEAEPQVATLVDMIRLGKKAIPGINVDWIIHGRRHHSYDPTKYRLQPINKEDEEGSQELVPSGYASSPVYLLGGAGAPHDLLSSEAVDNIILPANFIRPSIVPIKICGHSMEPIIFDGAFVGVDRDDRRVISGEIYAVHLPYEGTVVKRIYMAADRIILRSDNRDFPELDIPIDKVDPDNFIFGRVKWVLQEF